MNPHVWRVGSRIGLACLVVVVSGCRDVSVANPPPAPSAGSLQATVLYSQPGRAQLQPAVGARAQLLRTSVATTVADATGHLRLAPITVDGGAVLISFDSDGDGASDRQRLLRLEDVGAGFGKDVVLGQVVLGGNATVRGQVLGRDRLADARGHGGTTVFVPEGPFLTYTGDNGAFTLDGLPEGRLTLTFFRAGYGSFTTQVTLQAGQLYDLASVILEPSPGSSARRSTLRGRVLLDGQADLSGTQVRMSGGAAPRATSADGQYAFPDLSPGVYAVGFEHAGFVSAALYNVLVEEADVVLPDVLLVAGQSLPVTVDAGAPYDAGGAPDAGASDAGGTDAGASDAGGMDAGASDAGGVDAGSTDAGGVDAGGTDAGGNDAGALDAGPTGDAGQPPVAIVDPLNRFYAPSAQVTLVGQNSTGLRPLRYRWSQDAGPAIAFPINDSVLAATPRVTLPSAPALLRLALTVIDAVGRESAPAEFSLSVLTGAPVAVIAPQPPAALYAGQSVTVGSTGSADPSGTGIVSYAWSVVPASSGVQVMPQGNGSTCVLTMPSSVAVTSVVGVQLVVTNGFGVQSAPASASFNLTAGAAPTWSLSAGPLQVVAGGATVTLSAGVTLPSPGPTFSFAWTPTADLDAGALSWALSTPDASTAQFVAPNIAGPSVNLPFTVTATNTNGGVSPAQRSAQVTVLVQDRRPPQVAATSISGTMSGSPFGAWVEFDEDLAPVGNYGTTVTGGASYAARSPALLNNRRLRVVFDPFVADNTPLTLTTGQPKDLSQYLTGNLAVSQNLNFVARFLFPAPAVTAPSSTETNPAVVLLPAGAGEATALLLGRKDSAAVFHQPLPLESCLPGGCTVTEDTTAPVVALSPTGKRVGSRVVWSGGVPYVVLQSAGFDGTQAVIVARRPSGWATVATPPGSGLFGNASALFVAYAEAGQLKVSTYDAVGNTWSAPEIVTTSATEYPSTPMSTVQVWGHAASGGLLYVVARTAQGDVRSFQRPAGQSTWSSGNLALNALSDPIRDVRISYTTTADTSMNALILRQSGVVEQFAFGSGGTGGFGTLATGVTALDVANDVSQYVATIEAGQLVVRGRWSTFLPIPGPPRMSGPPNSQNVDTACAADAPTLQRQGEHLAVAWQERCAAGPYRTYLRWLR